MVSELWFTQGMKKVNSIMKRLEKKCSSLASLIKQSFKAIWNSLFSSKDLKSSKNEGLFSALTGTFQDENIWVIDSGASRHMIGYHKQLKTLSKGNSSYSVELGDNKSYPVKGIGSTSIELEGGGNIHLNNILYVPCLCKNLISISSLEAPVLVSPDYSKEFLIFSFASENTIAGVLLQKNKEVYKQPI